MKVKLHKYKIGIGMIRKGLDYIGFSTEDIIDIINYIDQKWKKIKD